MFKLPELDKIIKTVYLQLILKAFAISIYPLCQILKWYPSLLQVLHKVAPCF